MGFSSSRPASSAPYARRDEGSLVVTFAVCRDCEADIENWRELVLPLPAGNLAVTERGQLAVHVERDGICTECGGGRAEIRVEARDYGAAIVNPGKYVL